MQTYRAAVLKGAFSIEVEEIPFPELGPREVLVKVMACALCGSDILAYEGKYPRVKFPQILGHEFSGIVEAVGEGVTRVAVDERVCVENHIPCGRCEFCQEGRINICRAACSIGFTLSGAYAEYVRIPEESAIPLPGEVSFEIGALMQTMGVAYHAFTQRGQARVGDQVLITGGGPIGLCILAVAKAAGARVYLSDPVDYRLDVGRKMGGEILINPVEQDLDKKIAQVTGGRGVDVVFEAAGGSQDVTIQQATRVIKKGGRIVSVGKFSENKATLPINDLQDNEIELVGARGHPFTFPFCIELVQRGMVDLSSLVTHRISLEKVEEGLNLMRSKADGVIKVVICPHSE